MKVRFLIAISLMVSTHLFAQLPYQNPGLTSEQRAKDLGRVKFCMVLLTMVIYEKFWFDAST